jgi:hypothetical protein
MAIIKTILKAVPRRFLYSSPTYPKITGNPDAVPIPNNTKQVTKQIQVNENVNNIKPIKMTPIENSKTCIGFIRRRREDRTILVRVRLKI